MIAHSRPWIDSSDSRSITACLSSGMLATGRLAAEFEAAVAARVGGIDKCRSTPSGTDALRAALAIAGVNPGDEVVVPTYVCHDVIDAVEAIGAVPRLCDVGPDGTITAATAAAAMTARVSAIIAVHIFGNLCDIRALKEFGIPVIEDACQAFAAPARLGNAGALGDLSVLSFHATKCLTTGEGGMVLLPKDSNVDWVEGEATRRLSDLSASLGLSQLARYDAFIERREDIAMRYGKAFAGGGLVPDSLQGPFRFRYIVKVQDDPQDWIDRCARKGVAVRRGVDALLHRRVGLGDADFAGACALFNSNVSIPFYPALSDAQAERVIETMHAVGREFDGD